MKALKLVNDPIEKKIISSKVRELLQQAERIKLDRDWRRPYVSSPATLPLRPSSGPNGKSGANERKTRKLKEPKSTRELSRAEQILILKSSLLNGCKFPPWNGLPAAVEFELKDGEDLFLYVVDPWCYLMRIC